MAPLVSLSSVQCPPFCSRAADRPAAPSSPVDMSFGVPVIVTRRGGSLCFSKWCLSASILLTKSFCVSVQVVTGEEKELWQALLQEVHGVYKWVC